MLKACCPPPGFWQRAARRVGRRAACRRARRGWAARRGSRGGAPQGRGRWDHAAQTAEGARRRRSTHSCCEGRAPRYESYCRTKNVRQSTSLLTRHPTDAPQLAAVASGCVRAATMACASASSGHSLLCNAVPLRLLISSLRRLMFARTAGRITPHANSRLIVS